MQAVRVALPGAGGKMGKAIARVLAETDGFALVGAVERAGHGDVGKDAGVVAGGAPSGVAVVDSLEAALERAEVLIDFTAPAATARHAEIAAARGVALVVGTTGLGDAEKRALADAATRVPVVFSPNMSLGVNLLLKLLETTARALGDAYDVEIVEAHHRLKKDAPSGTAVKMAEVLARALGRDLAEVGVYGREGETGARTTKEIGIMTVRGGDVVGDHTAHFLGLGERLELTHRATSRDTFARGAVRAAGWVRGRAAGLYDMQDVLGLKG